jgi:hypothetical protein
MRVATSLSIETAYSTVYISDQSAEWLEWIQ